MRVRTRARDGRREKQRGWKRMTELEARAILNSYGAPVNIAKHIEAINTAIRALGGKATMAEIWEWAKQPEKEVNEWQDLITK